MSSIELKNVFKIFGDEEKKALKLLKEENTKEEVLEKTGMTVGVNNVSLKINDNEIFVIMGLSGSGKSTLLRCINRLIDPTSGEIIVDGENIVSLNRKEIREFRKKKFGMVFQSFALLPFRTVLENTYFGLEVYDISKEEMKKRAMESLKKVGLEGYEDQYPDQLSGGMQQRVGLARALCIDSDTLLMDEPFSALDPLIKKDMQDLLLEIYDELNKTIIFITHDLDEALRLGDTIAVMKDGVVVQTGTPEEILTNAKNEYIREFVKNVDKSQILSAKDIMVKPLELVYENDGPKTARYKMNKNGISSIFLVGKQRKLYGLVTIEDVTKAIEEKNKDLFSLVKETKSVNLGTQLNEIFEDISKMNHPLPVVEDGFLRGIIVKATVLSNL